MDQTARAGLVEATDVDERARTGAGDRGPPARRGQALTALAAGLPREARRGVCENTRADKRRAPRRLSARARVAAPRVPRCGGHGATRRPARPRAASYCSP